MARDWQAQFVTWARPPSATETQKMERAEKAIRDAIAADLTLQQHDIVVFPQGSYRNRTNVPGESDVDICVMARDVFFSDWDWVDARARSDITVRQALEHEAAISDAAYKYKEFKQDVGTALERHFGAPPNVIRGDKAYDIHENTYRVESDCLPAMEARLWQRVSGLLSDRVKGTEFMSDSGIRIQNFPQQQYENGVSKHARTGDRFKKLVRCLKNLRNEMVEEGRTAAKPIPSFLSECLVYRVPDAKFGNRTLYDDMREVLRFLYFGTRDDDACKDWLEENDIKLLFHSAQAWTRAQVNEFVLAAWQYLEYGDA